MPKPGLSPRQREFVNQFLVDMSATQAAVRAGYSPKTAKQQGSRLLSNVDVQAVLAIRKAALAERAEITVVDVLKMLEHEAKAGDLDIPNAARIKAQELIGKHIGMFSDTLTGQNRIGPAPVVMMNFNLNRDNISELPEGEVIDGAS